MICPHCNVAIHQNVEETPLFTGLGSRMYEIGWSVFAQLCPDCEKPIIFLGEGKPTFPRGSFDGIDTSEGSKFSQIRIWPINSNWICAEEVPGNMKEDFQEAAAVLSLSPKASAALSRRCLQHLLKEYAHVQSKDLSKQIQEVIESRTLSSNLVGQLDAIRNIGNFAAHPQKDKSTGEILPVEPHEAEWNLEVLQDLFDHYFVRPEQIKKRTEELNLKLAAAGKPPMPIP